jgi:hypothetical protein
MVRFEPVRSRAEAVKNSTVAVVTAPVAEVFNPAVIVSLVLAVVTAFAEVTICAVRVKKARAVSRPVAEVFIAALGVKNTTPGAKRFIEDEKFTRAVGDKGIGV